MAQMTATPVATHGFLLDGKWIEEGDPVEIRAPYDGSVVGRVFQGRREHAEAAIAAAVKAFGTTRRLPAFERQRVLRRVAESIAQRKEEFAHTLAQEAGKPIKAARSEVERSIFTFTVAARGEHAHLWRVSAARLAGIHHRTLGNCASLPSGADCRDHAVQFSAQPGCAQSRPRDCEWMHHGAEARATDARSPPCSWLRRCSRRAGPTGR